MTTADFKAIMEVDGKTITVLGPTHYDEPKKLAHDSQIVRTKENLKLSYDGHSQRQASGTNQGII